MYTELRTFTKDSLTAKLTELTNDAEAQCEKEQSDPMSGESIVAASKAGDDAREAFLSPLFGGRNIFSLFPSEITVYVDTPDEVLEVIKVAQDIGYKNIGTYIPKVCDGKGGSKPDPENNIAVKLQDRDSMIFGNAAKHMIKMFAEFVDIVKDEVVYTYCHNNDYRLTFRSEQVANMLCDNLNKLMVNEKAKAHKQGLEFGEYSITVKEEMLDRFVVGISIY